MVMEIGILCYGETRSVTRSMAIWRIFRHTGEVIGERIKHNIEGTYK